MDSEEPPNVRVACSGDIDEVVRLMHDAAAWMSAKGTPAWDVARIDRTFAETFVLRSELLVASCSDGIVGCCTLSAEDPEFWPDALKGEAAYLHKLAVRRTHAGRGVSSALIEACRHAARTQGCAKLRLDCHPNLRGLYERLGFTHGVRLLKNSFVAACRQVLKQKWANRIWSNYSAICLHPEVLLLSNILL